MGWVKGVVAYLLIWWVVIFAILPIGVHPAPKGEEGHAAGAPANPRLWFKVGLTTLIAGIIWAGFYAVATSNLISFRGP